MELSSQYGLNVLGLNGQETFNSHNGVCKCWYALFLETGNDEVWKELGLVMLDGLDDPLDTKDPVLLPCLDRFAA